MRASLVLLFALAACPAPTSTRVDLGTVEGGKKYAISGEVRGLVGQGLTLQLNGAADLVVSVNGAFTFSIEADEGADYVVTVLTQPRVPAQECVVQNGTGVATAPVSDVVVECTTSKFAVGGTVSGLVGGAIVLGAGTRTKVVDSNGAFSFAEPFEDLTTYSVTITGQPTTPPQVCLTQAASGLVNGKPVDTVRIECRAEVLPLFANGAAWNDYVTKGATALSTAATSAACNAAMHTRYEGCLHGGEMRSFTVHGLTSCAGLRASDSLGAFEWTCDDPLPLDDTNAVRMVSLRLAPGKRLRDLLDLQTHAFKPNVVTVTDAASAAVATSASTVWWPNSVKVAGTTIDEAGAVHLVEANGVYAIAADRASVVIVPTAGITPTTNAAAVVSVSGRSFVWVDGKIVATAAGPLVAQLGVHVQNSRFVVLRGVTVDNANAAGVRIEAGAANAIFDSVVTNSRRGIDLLSTQGGVAQRIVSARSTDDGIVLTNASAWLFEEVQATNSGLAGLLLSNASNNDFGSVRTSNGTGGIALVAGSDHNRFARITSTSNAGAQIRMDDSDGNWWLGVTIALGPTGIASATGSGNRVAQAAIASTQAPIDCSNGTLELAHHRSDGETLFDASPGCTLSLSGPTGATNTPIADLRNAFVGPVIVNDSQNPTDAFGLADLILQINTSPGLGAWYLFQNPFRAWGRSVAAAFLDPSQQGLCNTVQCRIYDWSLKPATPDTLRNVLLAPTVSDAAVHTWTGADMAACALIRGATLSGSCTSTFLPAAIEIARDDVGNDNWLCESGETCTLAPNIASYQGHGTGASTTIGAGGAVENVTLIAPAQNDGTTF